MTTRLLRCTFDLHCSHSQTKGYYSKKVNEVTEYQKQIEELFIYMIRTGKILTLNKGKDAKISWSELNLD